MTSVVSQSSANQVIKNSEHGSLFLILPLVFVLGLLVACQPQVESIDQINGQTMGTYYRVSIAQPADLPRIKNDVEAILRRVNQSMSTYIDKSELNRVNRAAADTVIPLSPSLTHVLNAALSVAQSSGGLFDPTIGPLVRLWGFGPGQSIDELPDRAAIQAHMQNIGFTKLTLDRAGLRKTTESIEIDLSAIAKGYAIDEIAEHLYHLGLNDWLIDIGGELRASGQKYDQAWRIAIEYPSVAGGVQLALDLDNSAVATSGDYRNFTLIDGQRYSHVINPKTGYPVTNRVTSASVKNKSAMMADAYATALLAMGEQAAIAYAEQHNLSVYLQLREDNGRFYTVATGEFDTTVE